MSKTEAKKIGRAAAAIRIVTEMGDRSTLEKLAADSDELVVAGGGKSNLGDAKYHVRRALETAEAFGLVKLVRPTDVSVTRVKK